ncbi:MAG: lipocalin family protein [Bacteroidales bacterium]|nr:lipocalin family protein [Bacteroidales bacterium]
MNKLNFLLSILFIAIATISFSQKDIKSEYSKMLKGTWKVDSLDISSINLSPEYEEIVRQKMPEIIAITEVQFKSGNKYYKKGFEGEREGTWSVSDNGEFILLKLNGDSKISKTRIVKLTEDKLILAPEEPSSVNSKAYMYKAKQ